MVGSFFFFFIYSLLRFIDYRKASEAGLPSLRVPVISLATGQSIGTEIDLDSRIFLTEIRNDIIHRVIVWQEHQNRTTLYKGKNRGEVRGGGRKPWRQKGTGRARQASIRSPLWEGGGVAHPPKLREWDTGLQRKVRRLGMRIALAAKFLDRRIMIVDKLDIITPTESTTNTAVSTDTSSSSAAVSTVPVKTKGAIQVLKTNQLLDRKVLFIYGGMNNHSKDMMIGGRTEEDSITSSPQSMNTDDITEPFVRSFANIPKCQILPSVGANVRDIIQAERIIVTVNALDQLSQRITRDM